MARAEQRGMTFLPCVFWKLRGSCFAFQWAFSYTGFPVEPDTLYFIGAHNIPTANMDGDSPSMSVNFTSPGNKLPSSAAILCPAGCLPWGASSGAEELGYPGHGILVLSPIAGPVVTSPHPEGPRARSHQMWGEAHCCGSGPVLSA